MLRREVLAGLAAFAAMPSQAEQLPLAAAEPFSASTVRDLAASLAAKAYAPPLPVNEAWTSISYDDYVSIWFDERRALFQDSDAPLRVDLFLTALYYPHAIGLSVVENGQSRKVEFSLDAFDRTDKFPDLPVDETVGFSGFRLRGEVEKSGIHQEFAVFQGASYFRAIGKGDIYGLSARGLAIDTAEPKGEEFPEFTCFWIERPAPDADSFVVHALLDSPSCTGAYRFEIALGDSLVMDVEAEIFARRTLPHVGIAPLTSMFQYDQSNRERFSDFRPAVHDNDGLLIVNGAGETIWRPLANPKTLQISAFQDRDPQGFGLMQRDRNFSDFNDLEALYHRRPSAWIEPGEGWGAGAVTLVEIPTDREIYDNIVAYWRPSAPLEPGQPHELSYQLNWGRVDKHGKDLAVLNTAIGDNAFGEGQLIVIDFEGGDAVPEDLSEIERLVRSSAGEVSEGVLQRNPETGGPRLAFRFTPGEATLAEFRVQLRMGGEPLSEVWLYRWTA
ncbi:MAG: glucan biosynthesis protein G [Rhodobacteraceae bacterium]|nr:glucan biosynthesis protein G [Paracoccaceae bacterium]